MKCRNRSLGRGRWTSLSPARHLAVQAHKTLLRVLHEIPANREAFKYAKSASCIFCLAVWADKVPKVKEWVNPHKGGEALCPNCGIDTLYPVALPKKWLKLMHDFWFEYATDHKVVMAQVARKLKGKASR